MRTCRLSGTETARPWTYLHREWVDDDGDRCCTCTGVVIERDDGSKLHVPYDDIEASQLQLGAA